MTRFVDTIRGYRTFTENDVHYGVMEIYTIGFTKKGAREFFELLEGADIERLVDVRLSNQSQLAGFAKRDDLTYFLDEILGCEYVHEPELAPTKELLDGYRGDGMTWEEYEGEFFELMEERGIEERFTEGDFSPNTVLLCSEHTPEHCHRRLIVEYLDGAWGDVEAVHLK